jgi:hypothetical protein
MKLPIQFVLSACLPLTGALAQGPDPLLTFSQTEYGQTSAGVVLQVIHPNEIAQLSFSFGCPFPLSAEKWAPRTCFQTMAGDENGDGEYWNPMLFGAIDALAVPQLGYNGSSHNPRSVFWSPAAPLGPSISAMPLRPGDVGRITVGGQVEYFMSREQFNSALGVPSDTAIDVDAIAFQVGLGVYFSLDEDLIAHGACGPNDLMRDGDVILIPDSAITWPSLNGLDYRVLNVSPNSAVAVIREGQFDAMLVQSQISDRNGAAVTTAVDLESLDVYTGLGAQITMVNPCGSLFVPVPDFVFSTSTMTGGGLLTTLAGGQVAYGGCGPLAYQYPIVQNGARIGLQASASQGPASYVNGLAFGSTRRFVLEPQSHQLNYGMAGGPPTTVYIGSSFPLVWTFIDFASPTVSSSVTFAPLLSPNCFPDWYINLNMLWAATPITNGFGSFTTPTIPVGWSGKLLFQSCALSGTDIEFSTPMVIDVH